jgi:acetyl esterase/lipase
VSNDGWLGDAAKLYANGQDLKDPQLSPIYGDLSGFPPTILTSGTRDLLAGPRQSASTAASVSATRQPFLNALYNKTQFWDGRVNTLEQLCKLGAALSGRCFDIVTHPFLFDAFLALWRSDVPRPAN